MYYHRRDLPHIAYGKVGPPPEEAIDQEFARAYRWLGQYCGFYPQVWLSRSRSSITGFTRFYGVPARDTGVLFGFDQVQGFPVDYDLWCELLNTLMRSASVDHANELVREHLDWRVSDPELAEEPVSRTWRQTRDLDCALREHLFQHNDQVVVPRLNLKSAKRIVCRNEHQKKALRRLGFIEDRIVIRGRRR